jgi:hypothetical protein
MEGAFIDWNHIYKETCKHLKAGSWVEVIDFDDYKGIVQVFSPGSRVDPWSAAVVEGRQKSRRLSSPRHIQGLQ